ncbi:argininosuccinate synthase [Saccharothrix tamanrassetensis]|uniref:argininosuccinate synthase n=1 Tax=Saccharothrix tamanrassetensis TaxID=1051531 RepID=A0A841CQP9_9PSEU|nr:argininosuccinate synthase domain-containing protein [Saccharothrix tamanrassetensis]MBB5959619.1 argininosuccinate synthase [Saccharothrix tamanrassetensis]
MHHFLTSLEEMAERPPRHMLLLYSGGLDGTYLLQRLRDMNIAVTALNVRIGESEPCSTAEEQARMFGVRIRDVDVTEQFFAEFLPAAVHADAYYQAQFPVGSTLTRPLMARTAVQVASELGCDVIGHTSTYMQNSAIRLSGSITALAPDIGVAAPFLGSDLSRSEKLTALQGVGISFPEGIHSIDSNPWTRVIECGSLESPENYLDESVFRWTRDVSSAPDEPMEISLTFDRGLPVDIDGTVIALGDLVERLNALGGEHGVGRFSGLEDTPFGVKNHEIREAPAATIIIKAHQVLANAVCTPQEHALRGTIAREWTTTVVHGGWFSNLGESLARCLADLDRPLAGTVRLRLHKGSLTVLSVNSPNGLYYTRLGQAFHEWMNEYSYTPWLSLATYPSRLRRSGKVE